MPDQSPIKYLTHNEIDKKKWDLCIGNATNSLIYAYSFYLDFMAEGWHALVLNDYEAVMPITWRKKWGIFYLYQPPFTQQLGVFSASVTEQQVSEFLETLKKHTSFAEILLNFQNSAAGLINRTNFTLFLNQEYAITASCYRKDAIKNIRRSEKFQLQYKQMENLTEAIQSFKTTYSILMKDVRDAGYANFERLCVYASENKMLVLRKAVDQNDEILAIALLLFHGKRLYLLQSTTLPKGRNKEANYFLLNNIISEFSNRDLILDFEGSDVPGIAHFYKSFGSSDQPYYLFKYNNLPWPLKLLKQ